MSLTGAQRRHLRALAHPLHPVVWVGHAGVNPLVLSALDQALEDHELLKVKVHESAPVAAREAAVLLAEASRAEVAQVIGRTVVLYRRRKEKPSIQLPQKAASLT